MGKRVVFEVSDEVARDIEADDRVGRYSFWMVLTPDPELRWSPYRGGQLMRREPGLPLLLFILFGLACLALAIALGGPALIAWLAGE